MRPVPVGEGEKKRKGKRQKDDSILRDSFYVAVSVYAPDFSTSPRAFEIPARLSPSSARTDFYDGTPLPAALLSLPPLDRLDSLKNDL